MEDYETPDDFAEEIEASTRKRIAPEADKTKQNKVRRDRNAHRWTRKEKLFVFIPPYLRSPIPSRCCWNSPFLPFFWSIASPYHFLVFHPHQQDFKKLQKLLITNALCWKHTSDPFCHFKWRPSMCFARRSGAETNHQATRKVLLNEMLKPFAIPSFNIIQQSFNSAHQNRTDVETNVEDVCLGL